MPLCHSTSTHDQQSVTNKEPKQTEMNPKNSRITRKNITRSSVRHSPWTSTPHFRTFLKARQARATATSQRGSSIYFRSTALVTIIPFHSTPAVTYHILRSLPSDQKEKERRADHTIIGRNLLFPICNIHFSPLPTMPTDISTCFPIPSAPTAP